VEDEFLEMLPQHQNYLQKETVFNTILSLEINSNGGDEENP
jgi:hypothetical protein